MDDSLNPINKTTKKILYSCLIGLLILSLLIASIFLLSSSINSSLYAERKTYLSELSEASAKIVDDTIESEWIHQNIFSSIVENNLPDATSINSFFEDTLSKYNLGNTLFFLVDSEGSYYSSDYVVGRITDREYYSSKSEDQLAYLSVLPHQSQDTSFLVLRSRLPEAILIQENTTPIEIQFCAMMVDLASLNQSISTLFVGAINTFIYSRTTGNMLYKNFGITLLIDGNNIYSKFSKGEILHNEKVESLIKSMKEGQLTVCEILLGNGTYYLCSTPLFLDDWSLFFVVQEEFLSDASGSSFSTIIILIAAIVTLLGLLFIFSFAFIIRKRSMELEKKNKKVIDVLASEYSSVYYIDLSKGKVEPYASNDKASSDFAQIFTAEMTYEKAFQLYVETMVFIEDQEKVLSAGSMENILLQLRNKKSFSTIYRNNEDGQPRYCEMLFVKMDEEDEQPTTLALGFADKDREIVGHFIDETLEADYEAIVLINLQSDHYRLYKSAIFDSNLLTKEHIWSKDITAASSIWTEDTRNGLQSLSDISFLRQMLSTTNKREFLIKLSASPLEWHRLTFQTMDRVDNHANSVLLTVSKLDEATSGKEELHQVIATQKEELETQSVALKKALQMAEAANRSKTIFLNSMSHDIRTPMNAIIGFSERAKKRTQDPVILDYLSKVGQASNHLLSLINDVLDMSHIESGKLTLNEKEESLADITQSVRSIVSSGFAAKKINFTVEVDNIQNETIVCDRLRLNQVLLNLLSNAQKYTKEGTVTLSITQLDTTKSGYADYVFRVIDTGIGMSPEFLSLVFEPFSREQTSTVSGIQGTGLGMAITKSIVELMGGKIDVTSKEGVGSEFRILFRFKTIKEKADCSIFADHQNERILLVDNHTERTKHLEKMFLNVGFRVDTVFQASEALQLAKKAKEARDAYHFILINSSIADIDFLSLIRDLRGLIGKKTSIIVMTEKDSAEIVVEAKKNGANQFVLLPFFPSTIQKILLDSKQYNTDSPLEEILPDFSGKRVLVVEDNELNREIALEILEEIGMRVDFAANGLEAVEKVSNSIVGQYDIILMDLQMPIMNGFEATRTIRKLENPEKANLPIIAMTANAFEEDRKAALASGMNEHLGKPLVLSELYRILSQYLKKG